MAETRNSAAGTLRPGVRRVKGWARGAPLPLNFDHHLIRLDPAQGVHDLSPSKMERVILRTHAGTSTTEDRVAGAYPEVRGEPKVFWSS